MMARPRTGETPVRSVRVGRVWDDAKAKAADEGLSMGDLVAKLLHRYMNEKPRRPRRPPE